jgi:hypothetical protein
MTDECEINQYDPNYIYCLVGDIIEFSRDEKHNLIPGTKHFEPNSKVYCMDGIWGDGYEQIYVIGYEKVRSILMHIIMSSKKITNWRVEKVIDVDVINYLKKDYGFRPWDCTEKAYFEMIELCKHLKGRPKYKL